MCVLVHLHVKEGDDSSDDSDSEFGDKKITQLSSLDEVLRKVRADSKRINVRTKSNLDTTTDIFKKDIAFRRKPRKIKKKLFLHVLSMKKALV